MGPIHPVWVHKRSPCFDDGPRPDPKIAGTCGKTGTYQPMRKQGAIILATGGDNSNSAMGKFYEGIMVMACLLYTSPSPRDS